MNNPKIENFLDDTGNCDWDRYDVARDRYNLWLYASDPYKQTPKWANIASFVAAGLLIALFAGFLQEILGQWTFQKFLQTCYSFSIVISCYLVFFLWLFFIVPNADDKKRAWTLHLKSMKAFGFAFVAVFLAASVLSDIY